MSPDTLLQHFDAIADAPNGVQKLRELILQLAVRGKLVPQDPSDEPASVLLERIEAEKQRLYKAGKIRQPKTSAAITADESEDLPRSWAWTRLEHIGEVNPRNEIDDDAVVAFCPMTLLPEKYGNPVEYEERPWKEIKKGYTHFAENDVVVAKITPCFQNGKAAVMRNLKGGAGAGTTELHVFRPIDGTVAPDYVLAFLKAPGFVSGGIQTMTGTAGQQRVSKDYFAQTPFPLPPVAEQHRIVEKVDQLMALCDGLEEQQRRRTEKRVRLNRASLHHLTAATDNAEMAEQWQHIRDNFHLLYDAPETVAGLRQAVLQLAVRGKLVPQDPSDESASLLLERIQAEKQHEYQEGRIGRPKPLLDVEPDEAPFELPALWRWVGLGDALHKITDGTHHSPPNGSAGKYKYITAKNIRNDRMDLADITFVSDEIHQEIYSRCNPEFGDILLVKDGATTGTVAVNTLSEPFSMLSSVALLKPGRINNRYVLQVLRSPFFFDALRSDMAGIAITRVTLAKLNRAIFPLPPLAEQRRIVEKVDQLMALCDDLEATLTRSRSKAEKLASAVVHHSAAA